MKKKIKAATVSRTFVMSLRKALREKIKKENKTISDVRHEVNLTPSKVYAFYNGDSSKISLLFAIKLIIYLEGYFDLIAFLTKLKKDNV